MDWYGPRKASAYLGMVLAAPPRHYTDASRGEDADMATRGTDVATRRRIAAWTRYLMAAHHIETRAELARRLRLSAVTVKYVLDEVRTPGLDFVLRLHREFHVSSDALLDSDPPSQRHALRPIS